MYFLTSTDKFFDRQGSFIVIEHNKMVHMNKNDVQGCPKVKIRWPGTQKGHHTLLELNYSTKSITNKIVIHVLSHPTSNEGGSA